MDRRDSIELPGSASYYMHQGTPESVLNLLSNPDIHFQMNTGGNLMGSSLPLGTSSRMSPQGISMGPSPPVGVGLPPGMLQGEPVRRKRGRPRKYGRELALAPSTSSPVPIVRPTQRRRGRPPGPSQRPPLVSLGGAFFNGPGKVVPHIINVAAGEDVKRKVLTFAQGRQMTVILSGIGVVSSVSIRIPTAGGSITYEGRFDILNLAGSYTYNAIHTPQGPVGSLSITIAGPEGHIIGGVVEGTMIAACHVQVIVGSLMPRSIKPKTENQETSANPGDRVSGNVVAPASA